MDVRQSIRNHVDLYFRLANHVFSTVTKAESNLVLSPLSINVFLGLIAAGSDGPTLRQLLAFLKSKSTKDLNAFYSQVVSAVFADGSPLGGPRLSIANGAWIDQTLPLKAPFKHVAETVYKAVSESVDFQNKATEVADHVNLWVEKETRGLIKQILSPDAVNSATQLILANALYFKGDWDQKFNVSETKEGKFHLLNGSSVQVPFMSSTKMQYARDFEGFKVLRLPYKRGDDKRSFSMYIFLPDAMDGLPPLMHKVATSKPGELWGYLPQYPVQLSEFRVPKFKVSFQFEVSRVLKDLGLVSPFAGEGLTEIVDGSKLHVPQMFHKSFIEVNEEGTEAAAVTGGGLMAASYSVKNSLDFVADHPFLYFIMEVSTGSILLVGTVINPL